MKNAYLRLKQQVEDLFTQIEAVKKKFGIVEKENEWMHRRFSEDISKRKKTLQSYRGIRNYSVFFYRWQIYV